MCCRRSGTLDESLSPCYFIFRPMETNHQKSLTRWRFWLGVCIGIILGLVMLAGLALTVIRARQPDLPVEWRQLRPGMSRTQVESTVPDSLHDLRELKGFDHIERQIDSRYVWSLHLYYNSQAQTTGAEIRLIHLRHGILGRNPEKLF